MATISFKFSVISSGANPRLTVMRGIPATKVGNKSFTVDGKRFRQGCLGEFIDGTFKHSKITVVKDTNQDVGAAIKEAESRLHQAMEIEAIGLVGLAEKLYDAVLLEEIPTRVNVYD